MGHGSIVLIMLSIKLIRILISTIYNIYICNDRVMQSDEDDSLTTHHMATKINGTAKIPVLS